MANQYTDLHTRVKAKLLAELTSQYTGIVIESRIWNEGKLPDFDRYAIILSPPQNDSWQEQVVSVRTTQYILAIDIYMLVKNYHDVLSWLGDTSPNLGLFQMISDVKDILRSTNLNEFLDKTYTEPAGPLAIEYAASAGFDSGEHAFVRRARLRTVFKTPGRCTEVATT